MLWHATGVLAALAVAATLAAPAPPDGPRVVGGASVRGEPIVAVRSGEPSAPVTVLVTGSIHGTEPAGLAVIRRLRRLAPPAGVQVWTVRTVNPDGLARGTRQNARGVDLNRNFPLALARRRRAVRRLLPRPARGLGARDARADAASSAASGPTSRSTTTRTSGW